MPPAAQPSPAEPSGMQGDHLTEQICPATSSKEEGLQVARRRVLDVVNRCQTDGSSICMWKNQSHHPLLLSISYRLGPSARTYSYLFGRFGPNVLFTRPRRLHAISSLFAPFPEHLQIVVINQAPPPPPPPAPPPHPPPHHHYHRKIAKREK